ncbi:MAG: M20/M25/M40 family metallo-hydrolase [Chloroflexi bacterium]|nr:M20/M25/M40 family metallo-hydrolase [Chloroflexota bacterium]MCI0576475.1 M20/M25/M40 family metallo-hydrolase [Chloroflexota bacterium]MCI0649549.1 M20/M25/M40 family metallo-hydrolase [Chloroflexota bacterium]MCI0729375.1 M20/M25/M40 family metallo-hydrolase [Chloroflexota bacterium]
MAQAQFDRQLAAFLEEKRPYYFDLLRQMVEINSFTANPEGVNTLGDLTAGVFAGLGFTARHVPATNPLYGYHLVMSRRSPAGPAAPTIGLISHLDTVFPPDEERRNNFIWQEEGDRLYGPGTVDIKGGTVLMFMVLDALQALAPEVYDGVHWVALLNAAEEELAPDFSQLCRAEMPPETLACLVFEGGQLNNGQFSLVTSRKGRATYQIRVEGRGAHAGSAHKQGANAVVQMAHTIGRVAGLTNYERNITFNVGTVVGGTVVNRVPHLAIATGEMRAFSPEVFAEGMASLLALQDDIVVRSTNGGYACQVTVDVLAESAPWPSNEATNSLLGIWQEAAATAGWLAVPEARGGLSDGNFLWDYVPTLDGLGPAGSNAHSSERSLDGSKEPEYAVASSFVPKAILNVVAILKLLGRSES